MPRPSLPVGITAALLAWAATAAEVDRSTLLSREEARAWRAVGRVNVAGARDLSQCTGTLIAPDVVLTAAHCLVHPGTGQPWPEGNVHFVAGWYGGDMAGYGKATALSVGADYRAGVSARDMIAADIGLIRLQDPLPAGAVAPLPVASPPQPHTPVTLVSYRRDRAHAPTLQADCRYSALDGSLIVLDCPVTFGASGAPVFTGTDAGRRIVGVISALSGSGRAFAVRVDEAVAKLLETLPESSE